MCNVIKLNNVCKEQITNSYPTVYNYSIYEKSIRFLLKVMGKEKNINVNMFFWHTALITIGKEKYYKCFDDDSVIVELCNYYDKILDYYNNGYKVVQVVDQVMNLYTLLYLKYELNINAYDKLINVAVKFIDGNYITGIPIPYRNSQPQLILVDTIGMICPLLMRYSYYSKQSKYYEIAVNQIMEYINNGINKENLFPYHAYNMEDLNRIGSFQWGRGIGWFLIGVIDSMEYINSKSYEYKIIKGHLNNFIDRLVFFQNKDGYFNCDIMEKDSHIDSSATAFIGYAIGRAIELKIIDKKYITIVTKCCDAISDSIDNKGRVWNCSEDCGGINIYSTKFSCNLANGISLALFSIMFKLGNMDGE